MVDATVTVEVPTKIFNEAGVLVPAMATLCSAWFSKRPGISARPQTAYCLCFDAVTGQIGEHTLIQRYYEGLKRVLRRPRMLTVDLLLSPADITGLNFGVPIRLRNVRAGSMYLNDGYYYLNKISNYFSDLPCEVTLIAV